MTATIGGVNVTAPLWNGASEAELRAIVNHLSAASYHYADDSGREWGNASDAIAQAVAEISRLKLSAYAIRCLAKDKPQLVTADDLFDAVLRDARK